MYPRNAASPERIAIGALVQISDGAVQSSGETITVRGQGGSEATGGGTTAYGASGIIYYTPTQAETNFTSFVVIASKTGCVPVSQTIVTTASATPGTVLLAPVTHTSAVVPTVSTLTGHTAQTGDTYARLGAPAGASVSADVAAVKVDSAAVKVKTDFLPSATAGAAGGLMIAGSNAATTLATLTVSGATTLTGAVSATGSNDIRLGATERGLIRDKAQERTCFAGTVGTGSTTASVVCSAITPATTDADQLKGRNIVFNNDTTTAALRGQAAAIVSHTSGSTPTFTLATGAFTQAPASGDTFTVV